MAGSRIRTMKSSEFDKGLLQWVKVMVLTKTFNRGNLYILVLDRQGQTRIDACPVHQDSTGSTSPLIAPFFGSGQMQRFSQCIQQRHTRLEEYLVMCPIDRQADCSVLILHDRPPL